jgi:hypothetical protein
MEKVDSEEFIVPETTNSIPVWMSIVPYEQVLCYLLRTDIRV